MPFIDAYDRALEGRYLGVNQNGLVWTSDALMGSVPLMEETSDQGFLTTNTPVTAPPFSLTGWFNSNQDAFQTVISIADSAQAFHRFMLQIENAANGTQIRARTEAGAGAHAESTTTWTVNTWHHACAVFAATNDRRAFLDGGGKGTDTTTVTPTSIDRIGIGQQADLTLGSDEMSGRLADARIYNRTLRDGDVLHQADVPTRWDLYYELGRVFYSFPAVAAVGNPWHVYAQQ